MSSWERRNGSDDDHGSGSEGREGWRQWRNTDLGAKADPTVEGGRVVAVVVAVVVTVSVAVVLAVAVVAGEREAVYDSLSVLTPQAIVSIAHIWSRLLSIKKILRTMPKPYVPTKQIDLSKVRARGTHGYTRALSR